MSTASTILGTIARVRKFMPDCTVSHLELLSVLALASEPMQPSEIAERMDVTRSLASRVLKDAVLAELVDLRVHPKNFRFRVVELTDLGKGVMEVSK